MEPPVCISAISETTLRRVAGDEAVGQRHPPGVKVLDRLPNAATRAGSSAPLESARLAQEFILESAVLASFS